MCFSPRRRWRFATCILAALLSFTGTASLRAQLGPCGNSCPGAFTTPLQSAVLTLPGGCLVLVHYYSVFQPFNCPFGFDQLHIVDIMPLSGCSMPAGLLMNMVTGELLVQNPMGFEPYLPDTCHTIQRVLPGTCWGYKTDPCHPSDTLFSPCDTNCCVTLYQVCTDSAGNRSIKRITPGGGPGEPCFKVDSTIEFCHPICQDTSGEVYYRAAPRHTPSLSRQMQGGKAGTPTPADVSGRPVRLNPAVAPVMQAVPVETEGRKLAPAVETRVRATAAPQPMRQH